MSKVETRLIKRKVVYIPVGEKLYRKTRTLEMITHIPVIDLTKDDEQEASVSTSATVSSSVVIQEQVERQNVQE